MIVFNIPKYGLFLIAILAFRKSQMTRVTINICVVLVQESKRVEQLLSSWRRTLGQLAVFDGQNLYKKR